MNPADRNPGTGDPVRSAPGVGKSRSDLRSSPLDVRLPPHGVFVFESHHSETFHMEMTRWPFHKIGLVAVGKGWLETPGNKVKIGADVLVHLPSDQPHRFLDDPAAPMTLVMVCWGRAAEAQNALIGQAIRSLSIPPMQPHRLNGAYQRGLIRENLRRMLREQEGGGLGSGALIHAGLLQLIVQMQRLAVRGEAGLRKEGPDLDGVIQYIEENFDKPLQLEDLAELCGLSTRRMTTLFKERTGRTVVGYLTEKRIQFAMARLRQTGRILYAAYEAGFTDLAYFYRVFKKATGITPRQFLDAPEEDWSRRSESN
ncbi:MAG: AraC family transcriptional regulator [Opitutaceae bacterium]